MLFEILRLFKEGEILVALSGENRSFWYPILNHLATRIFLISESEFSMKLLLSYNL